MYVRLINTLLSSTQSNHSVITNVFSTKGKLSLLKDPDTWTHRDAHFVKPFLGQIWQLDHTDLFLIKERRVFLIKKGNTLLNSIHFENKNQKKYLPRIPTF